MKRKRAKRPIAVDLFAGAGGMSLGFEQGGFDVLAAVEIDPIHCIIHEFNFPFCQVFCESVETITGQKIRANSQIQDQEITVVFGGAPCQGFSLIGKRMLDDPRNSLVGHFIRLILELQPQFFVFENVKGITIGKHKKFLEEIIDKLTLNSYNVKENYQILNAVNYAVPQNRERLFLLGARQDLTLFDYPLPITKLVNHSINKKTQDQLANLTPSPTVWDAIGDLPEVEKYPELMDRDWIIANFDQPSKYAQIMRGLSKLKDDYSYQRKYNSQLLTSSLRTQHTPQSIERFSQTQPGTQEPISRFYRLHPEGVCNTLRAGTSSDKGAFTSPRPIHPYTPRCITVREAARLHSYPDWFRFHVTKWHGFRQVGNSVPPLLAKAIALEILKVLAIEPAQPEIIYELGNKDFLTFNMTQAAQYYGIMRTITRKSQCLN